MPLNSLMPEFSMPCTLPEAVSTVQKTRAAAAHPAPSIPKNDRRSRLIMAPPVERLGEPIPTLISSVNRLLAPAGVSIKTVYRHFDNKDDLFSAVMQAACREDGALEGLDEPEERAPSVD